MVACRVPCSNPFVLAGERVTTPSGLAYEDILIGQTGDTPRPGSVVGFNAKVAIGGKILFDTANDKPVAFKVSHRRSAGRAKRSHLTGFALCPPR